jgi:hypothetical protein
MAFANIPDHDTETRDICQAKTNKFLHRMKRANFVAPIFYQNIFRKIAGIVFKKYFSVATKTFTLGGIGHS